MKAASHELKGLQCLYQSGMALGLNFPYVVVSQILIQFCIRAELFVRACVSG